MGRHHHPHIEKTAVVDPVHMISLLQDTQSRAGKVKHISPIHQFIKKQRSSMGGFKQATFDAGREPVVRADI